VNTFDPIKAFGGKCVDAVAALFANGFGTTTVRDPDVVANAATLSTTGNR
jgi:hypothetical protein